jgi:outer membrane protein insertion porin family
MKGIVVTELKSFISHRKNLISSSIIALSILCGCPGLNSAESSSTSTTATKIVVKPDKTTPAAAVKTAVATSKKAGEKAPAMSKDMKGRISKITFVQSGAYRFKARQLNANIMSKPSDRFNRLTLNKDIKRLYKMGYFNDVKASTKINPDGSIDVTFMLVIKPRIVSVRFEGNKKFSTKEIRDKVKISAGEPLNDRKFRESANDLRKFYEEKGYREATVTPELKQQGKDGIIVIFKIVEKLRYKVNNVTFEGATVYSQWDLKSSIANRYSILSWLLDMGLFTPKELNNDKLRLRDMYWKKGYLDFKVKDIKITYGTEDPEDVNLIFVLDEGKPYTVGKINIKGEKAVSAKLLQNGLRIHSGDTFDSDKVKSTLRNFDETYASMGYVDYTCRVERIPNYKTHIVDLDYNIYEGRKYFVEDVNISGNRITKDKVIRRELAIQPGDPVDKNRIDASKQRLMGMGYFKKVETVTVSTENIDKKDVNFTVDEKNPFNFKIGAGFSDTDSLVGMIELSNNNFDITDPKNLFSGGGQRFRIRGMGGLERNDLSIDFTEPWLLDMPMQLDVSGYLNNVSYEYWDESRIGVRTSLSRKVFDDFTSITAGYKFERVSVSEMSDKRSVRMRRQEGRSNVSQISGAITRDTRDNLLAPTSGYLVSLSGAGAFKPLGSSNNFYRLESKGIYFFSFFDKFLLCHVGAKIGTIADFDRSKSVPIYERYFLGGGDSLRGFEYRSVSPVDNQNKQIGGQSMALMTAEISHPIYKFIRGAVFVDAGLVQRKSFSYGLSRLNIGAGYGLRIKMPYLNAPVKLDLAYPVLSNQDGIKDRVRFHFNMGFTW